MTYLATEITPHDIEEREEEGSTLARRLNWLRAGVLGANDGIVSTSGVVLGVVAAGMERPGVLVAGVAAAAAGAVSMALGEYVSVSAQRDSERQLILNHRQHFLRYPERERERMAEMLQRYGISEATAGLAAQEMGSRSALETHLKLNHGLDQDDLTNPWVAAASSALSFILGALLPLLAVALTPQAIWTPMIIAITLIALGIAGFVSGKLGRSSTSRAVLRLIIGGGVGLAVTYGVGLLFGGSTLG